MKSKLKCFCFLICLSLLSACHTPLKHHQVDAQFNGINPSYDSASKKIKTYAPDKEVKVLIVHGMGGASPAYANPLVTNLAKKLGLKPCSQESCIVDQGIKRNEIPHGNIRIYSFLAPNQIEFTFYALQWSPLTTPLKNKLNFDLLDPQRSEMNQAIKAGIIDNGFVDVVAYLGLRKDSIQYAVRTSLCVVARKKSDAYRAKENVACDLSAVSPGNLEGKELQIITYSMGSFLVFDTLRETVKQGQSGSDEQKSKAAKAAQTIGKKVARIYMLANQLPLLELSQFPVPGTVQEKSNAKSPFAKSLEKVVEGKTDNDPKLSIIAFSDVNDILGYKLRIQDFGKIADVTNVVLSIAKTGYFWNSLACPTIAHTGYPKDPVVINLLAEGCNQDKPNECVTGMQVVEKNESLNDCLKAEF